MNRLLLRRIYWAKFTKSKYYITHYTSMMIFIIIFIYVTPREICSGKTCVKILERQTLSFGNPDASTKICANVWKLVSSAEKNKTEKCNFFCP